MRAQSRLPLRKVIYTPTPRVRQTERMGPGNAVTRTHTASSRLGTPCSLGGESGIRGKIQVQADGVIVSMEYLLAARSIQTLIAPNRDTVADANQ